MHGLRQPFRQGQQNRNSVLRHDRAMHVARVRHNNIAGNEFRKHQLVHGCGGRVYPAQLFRGNKLFRPQRPADENISIRNFLWHVIIAFKLKKLVLGKSGLKTITQP